MHIETTSVEVVPLDDIGRDPIFVKIDVQGYEIEVLRGLIRTIGAYKPVILIERNDDNLELVHKFLEQRGYTMVDYRNLRSIDLDEAQEFYNLVFWPEGLKPLRREAA
ncbi:MAG TPA: hypothetical protein DIT99_18270 [Candidatus Latescibacteria bacterium]|nr:hypothetical protein [Candidatus Latescibacterota bacterium]